MRLCAVEKGKYNTHFQMFMSFFNCLPILFLLPVMAIFPEVSKHLPIKQYNGATCNIQKNYQDNIAVSVSRYLMSKSFCVRKIYQNQISKLEGKHASLLSLIELQLQELLIYGTDCVQYYLCITSYANPLHLQMYFISSYILKWCINSSKLTRRALLL